MWTLTPLQQERVRFLFSLYDRRGNGYLERADFEALAHAVALERGHALDSPEHEAITRAFLTQLERYKAVADFARNGRIGPDEWVDFFEIVLSDATAFEAVVSDTLRFVFDACDLDDDATICVDELARLRRLLGVEHDDTAALFARLDEDGDGCLSSTEVRHAIEQFLRAEPPDAPGATFFGDPRA